MDPADADWDGPFSTLYHEWTLKDGTKDDAIGRQLEATYRSAWASANPAEQYCVVFWIMRAREETAADLIREALTSDVDWLASHAAPVACTVHGLFNWDLGEDIGDVFFELVLKQPHLEILRWQEIVERDDDPRCGPFAQKYLRYRARKRARPKQERELLATHRQSWAEGDWREQAFVLEFISSPPRPEAVDVIAEGLRSKNDMVVESAVKAADFYIYQGIEMGPDFPSALRQLSRRSPRQRDRAKWMLKELAEKSGKEAG